MFRVNDIAKVVHGDSRHWRILAIDIRGVPTEVQDVDSPSDIFRAIHPSRCASLTWVLVKRHAKRNIVGLLDTTEEE